MSGASGTAMAVIQAPVRNGPRLRHARRSKNDSLKPGSWPDGSAGTSRCGKRGESEQRGAQAFHGHVSAQILARFSSSRRVYHAATHGSGPFEEEATMKQVLQALLCFVCAAHVVIGVGLNLAPGFPR